MLAQVTPLPNTIVTTILVFFLKRDVMHAPDFCQPKLGYTIERVNEHLPPEPFACLRPLEASS